MFLQLFPSSETQGESVGSRKKAGRKFLSRGERAPGYRLSPSYFQKFKRMTAPDWAQKMLCIIVPNRRTVSPEFFSWVRTRRLLPTFSLGGRLHRGRCHITWEIRSLVRWNLGERFVAQRECSSLHWAYLRSTCCPIFARFTVLTAGNRAYTALGLKR